MKHFFLLLAFLCIKQAAFSQGYRIEVDIKGASDSTVVLVVYSSSNKYAVDTATLDAKGHAVFSKPTPLEGGMYLVALGRSGLFDFLISDEKNQHFAIQTAIENPLEQLRFVGSPENEAFMAYVRYKNSNLQQQAAIRNQVDEQQTPDQQAKLEHSIQLLRVELQRYSDSIAAQHPNTTLALVVKALNAPEPPELSISKDTPKYDSLVFIHSYLYNKEHFLDNVDFGDDRIIRTPFFEPLLFHYFDKLLYPQPDSIIPSIDKVLKRAEKSKLMYRYVLSSLFNHYMKSKVMGQEAIVVYLAEVYYLSGKTDWESDKFRSDIQNFVNRTKPTLIGEVAPPLKMETLSGQYESLEGIDAPYIILYFYEPGCSHCKTETPKVYQLYEKYKEKGVQAIGVYTQQDKTEWTTYVADQGLNWINLWDPKNENNFRELYNVYSTPQTYILDKNKKVVGRRLDAENADKLLEALIKFSEQKR